MLPKKVLSEYLNAGIGILLAGSLTILLMLYPASAYAGLSITVTAGNGGGDWNIGKIAAEGETDTETSDHKGWTISGPGTGTEHIDIRVNSTGNWSADTAVSANKFVLEAIATPTNIVIKSTNVRLKDYLVDPYALDLWFKAPTLGSEDEAHTLTVTLTATDYTQCDSACQTLTDGQACGYKSGDGDLPACQTCSGGPEPANYAIDTKDTDGSNLCTGDCYYCSNSGTCWFMRWNRVTRDQSATTQGTLGYVCKPSVDLSAWPNYAGNMVILISDAAPKVCNHASMRQGVYNSSGTTICAYYDCNHYLQ